MSANSPIFFAPYQTPFVDLKSGIISREWYLFLQAMFNRVGGTTGAGNDDLAQQSAADIDLDPVLSDFVLAPYLNQQQTAAEILANVTPVNFGVAPGNVLRYVAAPTNLLDWTAAITTAISVSSTVFFPPGTYPHASTLTLKSGVILFGYGAILKYTGSAQQITCPATGVLIKAGVIGLTLDPGSTSTKCLELLSSYCGIYRDILIKGTSTTNFALDVLCNSTGTTQNGNYNSVFNTFDNITLDGSATCGTFLRLKGQAGGVVTDNTFHNCNIAGNGQAQVRGIDFASFCDTIHFSGVTRLCMTASVGATGVGVEVNTQDPTNINAAVYNIGFDLLAVDTFGSPAGDARVGLKLNATKHFVCTKYFNSPTAAGGDFVKDNTNTLSYWVNAIVAGTNDMVVHTNQTYIGGTDNGVLLVGGELSTQDGRIVVGNGRSGNGNSYLDLIGDTTNTAYGLRVLRSNGGANTVSQILHKGTGNLALVAQDAGAQVLLQTQSGVKMVASDTGLGFYGASAVAQPTTAGASAAFVANAGTAVNDASTFDGYTLRQIVKALRTLGVFL